MDRIDTKTALAAYVRARLLREEKEAGRGYRKRVAEKTKLSQPHVSNIMNREGMKVGVDAADGFALLWGMTTDQLLAAAVDWARTIPRTPELVHLPNLEDAVAFLRGRGPLPDEAVEEAQRIGREHRDFSPGAWITILGELAQAAPPEPPRDSPPVPAASRRRRRS